jgi:HEPN domain-containing protein
VCFHAQQAVEKALKAVLIALQVEPQRTHAIAVLVRTLGKMGFDLPAELEPIELLTMYAVEFRYPGEVTEPDEQETSEAVSLAQATVSWAQRNVTKVAAAST